MANDFHVMRIHNRLSGRFTANFVIPPDDLATFVPPPERAENGAWNLVVQQPTDETRHVELGKFMDAWSKLELTISQLLESVLKTAHENMPVIMNSLGTRGQLDVLSTLGPASVPAAEVDELKALIQRIRTNGTRRNHIVHGYWLLEITVRDHGDRPAIIYNQYRAYDPSDPDVVQQIQNPANRNQRERYLFSVARISALRKELDTILKSLQDFNVRNFRRRGEAAA